MSDAPKRTPGWHNSRYLKRHPEAKELPGTSGTKTTPPEPGLWMNVLEVVEQPFVLTAVAILAALVDLISHAPVLLLVGLLVLAGVHRSAKLARKPVWKVQIPVYAGLLILMSVVFFGIHILLRRSTSELVDEIVAKVTNVGMKKENPTPVTPSYVQNPAKPDKQQIFKIEDRLSLVNMNRDFFNSSNIWVSYGTVQGQAISPVAAMIYLDITNLTSHPETIKTYHVSIRSRHFDWASLIPMNFRNMSVFFVYNDITKAHQLDFRSNGLDYKLDGSIPGHESIHGWLMFDTTVRYNVENEETQYRFYGETFSGERYDETSKWSKASRNIPLAKSSNGVTAGPLIFSFGNVVDLSGATPRFFAP